jgi:hypothetical protein
MLKKLGYAVSFFALWCVSVGMTASVMNVLRADKTQAPAWTRHPNANNIQQPTILTKHELFSEDHTAEVLAIQEVWAAYGYANDSHNGPLMASLFTPDAIVHFVYDNVTLGGPIIKGQPTFIPHFGIVAPADQGTKVTPAGKQLGSGCVLHGRADITQYYGLNRLPVLPWPGHSHHESTAMMVKVGDDNQTAILSTPYVIAGVDDQGTGRVSSGGYRGYFKKTSEGWEVAELYAVDDSAAVTAGCDLNGPFPKKQQ